jgi:hypothetical protein
VSFRPDVENATMLVLNDPVAATVIFRRCKGYSGCPRCSEPKSNDSIPLLYFGICHLPALTSLEDGV